MGDTVTLPLEMQRATSGQVLATSASLDLGQDPNHLGVGEGATPVFGASHVAKGKMQ